MCCDYDSVDDLRWELHTLGLPADLAEICTIELVGQAIYRAGFSIDPAVALEPGH